MLSPYLQRLSGLDAIRLRWFLVTLAALVAAQICYIQHGWINNDTVVYLESARLFAEGSFKKGFEVFPWPLYSLLIAGVHQITTSSLHLSAQLLSVALFALTTYFFTRLIMLAGGNNLAVASGALILFSSHYVVGDVMEMLMRDQGFWAFFLGSLMFFIRFMHDRRWMDALLWQACIVLATLFRIEGIVYLLGLPLILLTNRKSPFRQRPHDLFKAITLPLSAGVLLLIVFQLNQQLQMQDLGRLKEVFTWDLINQLTEQFRLRSQIMAEQVLGNFLDGYATQGLLLTLAFILLSKILSSTGLINLGLAAFYATRRNAETGPQTLRVLYAALLIGVINAQLIILKVFVLSSRYIVPLILLLMIFAALGLARLAQEAGTSNARIKRWLLAVLLIIMTLGLIKNLLPKPSGHNYQQEAIAWLADKGVSHQVIYFHDARLRHYAGAPFVGTWQDGWERLENQISSGQIAKYKYLVINIEPEDAQRTVNLGMELPEFREVSRHYAAKRKKYVLILQNTSYGE